MNKLIITVALPVLMVFAVACATLKGNFAVPGAHPEELPPGAPVCTDCHEAKPDLPPYWRFNHSASFSKGGHRAEAGQNEKLCSMCHAQSFCNDCHVTFTELKPTDRRIGETYRKSIHRGDYKTRHQIDGRVDPASCFGCHGNPKASAACGHCHGR